MKTIKQLISLSLIFLLAFGSTLRAQDNANYTTVSGEVMDQKTKKKLGNVSVSIPGTNIGTVTNEDGEFVLKIKDSLQAKFIEIADVGYSTYLLPLKKGETQGVKVLLNSNVNVLSEVVIHSVDPLKLVEDAIAKIGDNYCPKTNLLTGFYRETIKKGRNYINISEAVVDVYKTHYKDDIEDDRMQVCKGRRLLSQKAGDTIIVKFQGGPNLSVYLDLVKNHDLLFNSENLSYYKFTMGEPVMIDERAHYVVHFTPKVIAPFALYDGNLYIDRQSLAFSRAEFSFNMDDKQKVTQTILRKKPFKLNFKPEEVSFLVTYKQRDGISYLNYIRNEVRFKCDWKKKLFPTSYTILSEMVVTEGKERDINVIPYKASFKANQILSDRVGDFADANFWEDYNIIEPTESLESAVGKLKKQYK